MLLALLTAPASADFNVSGDWVVTASESYANERIVVSATNATDGNVVIMPGGALHLENVTLVIQNNRTLDNQGYLEIRNSTVMGPNWFFYLRGAALLDTVRINNATRDAGAGLSATYVVNTSVSFNRVNFSRTFPNTIDWFVRIRVIMDFEGNSLGSRGQLRYELPAISRAATIEIANNTFAMGTMMTSTTAIVIENALHTGAVTYDIHDNAFTNGDDAISFGSSSPSTTYLIHDNTFSGMGSTAIEVGQGTGTDRFGGVVRVWDCAFSNMNRALRLYGATGGGIVGTIENITITHNVPGPMTGIVANEATWEIRNSTMSLDPNDAQYVAEANGRIRVWNTADAALNGQATAAGASVEHYAFLNIASMAWQGGVPIQGDLVLLRNPTGGVNFQLDATTWVAQQIVWWGIYNGNPDIDNRDLRPEIQDGPRTFVCLPSQFFVSDPMAAISITCTDDAPPALTIAKPPSNWLQNWSELSANGSGAEYGSGLNTFDWSLDNASWGPVTLGAGAALNWSVLAAGLTDGLYTLYLRAADRVGLVTFASRAPITIDLTAPALVLPLLPTYASGSFLNLSGSTEPFAAVSYLTAGGSTATVGAEADGSFAFTLIPLVEGLNTLWITATDLAGNTYTRLATISVDSVPPSLAVFLEQTVSTNEQSIEVAGLTEAGAVVRVNQDFAARAGESFTHTLGLTPGLNAVTVTSADAAGNTASWYGVVWFDDDAPALQASISTGNVTAEGIPVTRAAAVPLTGSVTDATTRVVSLTINGQPYTFDGAGAFFVSLPVVDGDNTVVVTATDVTGNVATRTLRVLRDSTAPTAVATLLPSDAPIVTIDGLAYTTGRFVIVSLEMSEDGIATVQTETRTVTVGANVFNVSLFEGTNSIGFSFRDRAGNLGAPRTAGIVRDTTAPAVSISSPLPGAAIDDDFAVVEGVTEPGSTVLVNGEPAAVNAGGGFSARVAVAAGTSTPITVVTSDTLGNSNSTTLSVTRRSQTVTTGDAGNTTGLLMLAVGAGVGLALGFLLRGRSRGGAEAWPAADEEPTQRRAPAGVERAGHGPKGPRGPKPPEGP